MRPEMKALPRCRAILRALAAGVCLLAAALSWGGAASGAAAPAPEAVRTLDESLGDLADSLRALGHPRAAYVIGCADAALPLDGYAAETLAARLDRPASPAARANGSTTTPGDPFAETLPPCFLQSLSSDKATVFVRLGCSVKEQQRILTAAVYDLASGRVVSRTRVPFQLPSELEVLVTGEVASLSVADKQWSELFDELFPPPARGPQVPDASVRLAQAGFFMDTGLWGEAARRFAELAGDSPNRLFARAVLARQLSGDADGAQALVQSALKLRPDSGPLYALAGWLSLRHGQAADALMQLQQARLSDMAREGLYTYARGLIALEGNEQQTAEQALTRAAELLPDKLFAQWQAAHLYWQRADMQSALRYYRRATQTSAATAETWAELAMVQDAASDVDGAVSALRQAFHMRSDNPVITRQFAAMLKRQGHFDESLQVLQRAKDANPCSAPLLAAFGDGAAEMWQVRDAEAAFRDSITVSGGFPYGVARLTEMLRLQRRYPEAQTLLMDLLAARPDYQPARLELGRILGELGRPEEAVSVLNDAAKSPQYEVDAKLAMADLYLALKQPDQAVASAQIAVSLRPDAQTFSALSAAFLSDGDTDKALSTAKSALAKGPDSADAHLALARVLDANRQAQDALKEVETALRLNPYSVQVLSLDGTLHRNQNDLRECAALWQRALTLNPWDADLHYRLAELLGKSLGDSAGALEHYNQYFELEKLRTGATR